ncbi:hypothetical protein Q9R08_05235 [Microbacterium sp. QXD-8]|uniref:Phage tail protein n=1 Tax=Microbacterium psychrotolerans TaxID=3068321 RepID=A0ABU0YYG7_9MICO|nr:hypothetical protein [Microbacterium sp. QXD-8]MDQ7877377.1 hypothetical protein [Microbacterium sp. QXD-8]
MAITSRGYEGTIDYEDWAIVTSHFGSQYSVFGADAFSAAAGASDREVVLQPGRAAGHGILDDSDATISVVGGTVATGSRWDLIALRRNWATGATTPVIIAGSAAKAIPARENDPGEEKDDQPLWLARFSAGQTAVQELVDLRCWFGDGGMVAKDLLARDYLTRIGTRIRIQGISWMLAFDGATPAWVPDSVYVGATAPPYFPNLGWLKVP